MSERCHFSEIFFTIQTVSVLVATLTIQLLKGLHPAICEYERIRCETILAGPAASGCGDAEDFGAWHVVGDWFLFYGVDVAGYDFAVDKEL
jgi:hypothetical protein